MHVDMRHGIAVIENLIMTHSAKSGVAFPKRKLKFNTNQLVVVLFVEMTDAAN